MVANNCLRTTKAVDFDKEMSPYYPLVINDLQNNYIVLRTKSKMSYIGIASLGIGCRLPVNVPQWRMMTKKSCTSFKLSSKCKIAE